MSLSLSAIALLFGVLVLLSRASEPSMVLAEQGRTQDARATVIVQATRIAYLQARVPTARPCPNASSYYYSC